MSATVPPGTSGQHTADTGIDTSVPSVARIYDYALGGKDNFQVDREAAQELL
ncbi:MAG: SAM-dependent methyltransferase, partial [Saccharopolyspora rectivirgula]